MDLANRPGLREDELRRLGPCAVCGEKLFDHKGSVPLFYVLRMTRAGFDLPAVQRRVGLGLMIGEPLARAMGPDEHIAKIIDGPVEIVVHEDCAGKIGHLLLLWPEGPAEGSEARAPAGNGSGPAAEERRP